MSPGWCAARWPKGVLSTSWCLPWEWVLALAAEITVLTKDGGGKHRPDGEGDCVAKPKGDAVCAQAFSRDLRQLVTGFLHSVEKGGLYTL